MPGICCFSPEGEVLSPDLHINFFIFHMAISRHFLFLARQCMIIYRTLQQQTGQLVRNYAFILFRVGEE